MALISDPNARAAHHLLTELRTRISTQPLPYQYGVEASALQSMWKVFEYARDAIKENPGCEKFAGRTATILNTVVRPLTGKWDRAFADNRLNGRDSADEFRSELKPVQEKLSEFARELHLMAYGCPSPVDSSVSVMSDPEMEQLFSPLKFGIMATSTVSDVMAKPMRIDEAEAIKQRRVSKGIKTPAGEDAIGLALSGGGIRSATFGLGVVQVLADKGFLKEVDFLSTVSGGGYVGSFLTQQLGQGQDEAIVAGPHGPDPEPVRYLRQRARYLVGKNLAENWAMVAATLAGTLLNWTAPLAVISAVAWMGVHLGDGFVEHRSKVLFGATMLSLLAMVFYALGMRHGRKVAKLIGGIFALLLAFIGVVSAGIMLDRLFQTAYNAKPLLTGRTWGIGGLLALLGSAPSIIRFVPVLKAPKTRKVVLRLLLALVGLLVPVVIVILFYSFLGLGLKNQTALGISVCGFAVVSIFMLNANLTAPHRLYRDCLAQTFIQRSKNDSLDVPLASINPQNSAPYHILNATLNVPTSEGAELKDRGCDFFIFSKYWIGAPAIGYHRTKEWNTNGSPVDLATAMAVSGAAFSSHMGLGSTPTLRALLTLLNVRLGFWIKKPNLPFGFKVPGFGCLLREMFKMGMSEKRRWLNLSDGGHIENMGIYELLRRRCKFIICADGEADPAFTFHGLMTILRHAQIDFGIEFQPVLDDLRPDSATGYTKSHFHFCRVKYADETYGLLLYIKLAATGNESELIKRYRIVNPEFPHQTTLDQFFDQEQFEAYRQLGVHTAEGLFKPALMDQTTPASIPAWFRKLAQNLLEPNPPSR